MSLLRFLPDAWKDELRRHAGAVTPRARLENLRRAGFNPRQIIDAGAYRGEWTRLAREIFPTTAFLLIEPQPQLAAGLAKFCATMPAARFRRALLGATPGQARFLFSETNSRVVAADYIVAPGEIVQMLPLETLAGVCAAEGFSACDLLKLDLQGHELEALAGAGELFGRIEVILTEVSWLRIGPMPLIAEVFAAFAQRGYRPYDVWGFNYRPRDGALWQTDVVFVRADSPLLSSVMWG